MRSCRGYPFYFRSWESSLAWVACGLGPETCANLSIPYFPVFQSAAYNMSRVLMYAEETGIRDPVDSFHFCFWITLAQGLPWIFLLVLILYLAVALSRVPFVIASSCVQAASQIVAYTHVKVTQKS